MPSGKTHAWVGFGASCVLTYMSKVPIELALFGVIGSLWPDTDKRGSLLGRFIPLWLFFKHRRFTHSWAGLALFTAVVVHFYGNKAGLVFAAGYFSHMLLDWRIQWLWPKHKKKRR